MRPTLMSYDEASGELDYALKRGRIYQLVRQGRLDSPSQGFVTRESVELFKTERGPRRLHRKSYRAPDLNSKPNEGECTVKEARRIFGLGYGVYNAIEKGHITVSRRAGRFLFLDTASVNAYAKRPQSGTPARRPLKVAVQTDDACIYTGCSAEPTVRTLWPPHGVISPSPLCYCDTHAAVVEKLFAINCEAA